MHLLSRRSVVLALGLASFHLARAAQPPSVMLANVYREGMPLSDYLVSEKFDGVRAYWDGQQLLTRGGQVIAAPDWFTAGWPQTPMDGELWAGRGQWSVAASAASKDVPDPAVWAQVSYQVFDLPAHPGAFSERLVLLRIVVSSLAQRWVQPVVQFKVADQAALMQRMRQVVAQGGEGLVLHRTDSLYRGERNDDLLKLKPYDDAEARVIAQVPGHGKYEGLLGALQVETPNRQRFRIGSGFSDADRRAPPPVGSLVTYRYRGLTATGLPRFATYLRPRVD
jgi:DNA ligase-1